MNLTVPFSSLLFFERISATAIEYGYVRVVPAGVHHAGFLTVKGSAFLRGKGQAVAFGYRQCIHIGTQRNNRPGLGTFQNTYHTGFGYAGLYLNAERL